MKNYLLLLKFMQHNATQWMVRSRIFDNNESMIPRYGISQEFPSSVKRCPWKIYDKTHWRYFAHFQCFTIFLVFHAKHKNHVCFKAYHTILCIAIFLYRFSIVYDFSRNGKWKDRYEIYVYNMCVVCAMHDPFSDNSRMRDGARQKIKWDDVAELLMMILFKLPHYLIHHAVVLILKFAVLSLNFHMLDLSNIDRSGIHLRKLIIGSDINKIY